MGQKYAHSPIIEAVCEIRFGADSQWDMAVPGIIYERVKDTFPKRQQIKALTFKLTSEPEFIATDRMQFLSEDGTSFIQVSPHFLAVNHLKPYPHWETYSSLVEKGFDAYRAVTNPNTIERVGLRYINNILFEEKRLDLPEFFNFYPFVGDSISQDYDSFSTGIQIPFADGRDRLKIELASRYSEQEDQASIILDLDYILMQPASIDLDDLLAWVNEAHQHIGETFEACITNSLREKFGKERTEP